MAAAAPGRDREQTSHGPAGARWRVQITGQKRRISRMAVGMVVGLVLCTWLPCVAAACALDSTPSLIANGVQATTTKEIPTRTSLWAPFTIVPAFATGAPILFTELRADLARSLPPSTLAAPYRWAFGDGSMALGHVVSHHYARPGRFRLVVYGFYNGSTQETHGWFLFDSALLRIVPRGSVQKGSLGSPVLPVVALTGALGCTSALVAVATRSLWKRRRPSSPPA
jgi:hypothetical protein